MPLTLTPKVLLPASEEINFQNAIGSLHNFSGNWPNIAEDAINFDIDRTLPKESTRSQSSLLGISEKRQIEIGGGEVRDADFPQEVTPKHLKPRTVGTHTVKSYTQQLYHKTVKDSQLKAEIQSLDSEIENLQSCLRRAIGKPVE